MFRDGKPSKLLGQALRPEPAMAKPPAAYGGFTAGVAPPDPGRAWPSPLRPERPAAALSLPLTSGEGVWGHAPMSTPNATPCPVLRQCVSRSRSTYSARRVAQWHNPTRRPLRALLSRYLAAAGSLRAPAGATTMPQASPGGPRAACRRGVRKAVGRAGPPQDGPKLGLCLFAYGAGVYWLFIFCVVEDVRRKSRKPA